jgi:hypothetical protein
MRSGYPWLPCAGGNAKHRDDPGRTCSTERPSETRPPRPSFLRFGGVPAAAPQQTQRRWARARLRRHRSVVLCQPEAVVLAPASCQHQEGEQEVAPLPREQLWGREPWTAARIRRRLEALAVVRAGWRSTLARPGNLVSSSQNARQQPVPCHKREGRQRREQRTGRLSSHGRWGCSVEIIGDYVRRALRNYGN